MQEVKVEVLGPEPACVRCQTAKKIVEKVAEKLQKELSIKVEKVNIISKEIIGRYGVLVSPAIAIDGVVKVMGRVPSEEEIGKLIKDAAEKGV